MLKEVLPSIKAPVVVFVYFNQLLRRGMDEFCAQAKAAGAAGLFRVWRTVNSHVKLFPLKVGRVHNQQILLQPLLAVSGSVYLG